MKKSKLARIDEDFLKDFDEIRAFRIANKLDKPRELSDRELTRMMRNATSYKELLKELKLKPRRRI